MATDSIRGVFGEIADAIRAKDGTSATITPVEMPTKIASISTTKYGMTIDGIFGDVDGNGVYQPPTTPISFSSTEIVTVPEGAMTELFQRGDNKANIYSPENTNLVSVILPNLRTVNRGGMFRAFSYCQGLRTIDFSGLISINSSGLERAFEYSENLGGHIDLSSLKMVYDCGLDQTFRGCTSIRSVDLSSLKYVRGTYGLDETFKGCTNLRTVVFGPLQQYCTFRNTFNGCNNLEVVDLSQSTIVPTMYSGAFPVGGTYKVVVPDALYEQWIAAENWSSISPTIIKKSDYIASQNQS